MDRHEYMTTGEFASAMGVSKDTLFHYDDIGLFCPEKVSENQRVDCGIQEVRYAERL